MVAADFKLGRQIVEKWLIGNGLVYFRRHAVVDFVQIGKASSKNFSDGLLA